MWHISLVRYFVNSSLPFKVVESTAQKLWGQYGLLKVFMQSKGHFIFKFNCEEDRDNVLALGPWYFLNKLFLKQWKEGIVLSKDVCTKTPVWVKFHQMPLSYWSSEGLGYI